MCEGKRRGRKGERSHAELSRSSHVTLSLYCYGGRRGEGQRKRLGLGREGMRSEEARVRCISAQVRNTTP